MIARTAIVAGGSSAMRARKYRGSTDRHDALTGKILGDGVLHDELAARHFHGRQEFAVGQLRKTFRLAAHSDEILDIVIPGSDVLISNGPVSSESFAHVGFKIEIAPAIGLTAPDDGTSPNLPSADPQERLIFIGGVGVLFIVDEKLAVQFAERAALLLDRLFAIESIAVAHVTKSFVPDGDMLHVILTGLDRPARFQDERLQTFFSKFLGCPATGYAGAHHDSVVCFHRHESFAASFSSCSGAHWTCCDGITS